MALRPTQFRGFQYNRSASLTKRELDRLRADKEGREADRKTRVQRFEEWRSKQRRNATVFGKGKE